MTAPTVDRDALIEDASYRDDLLRAAGISATVTKQAMAEIGVTADSSAVYAEPTAEQRERAGAPPTGLKGKALARYILTGEHVQQQVASSRAARAAKTSTITKTQDGVTTTLPGAPASAPPRGPREGSALAAAVAVLNGAKDPLSVQEIYDRAKAKGLAGGLKGKTPVATLGAQLATANKKGLYVERPAPGRYQLRKSDEAK